MVSGGGGVEKCYFNAAPKKVAKQVSRFTFKASGKICLRLPFYSNISNKVQYWCRQFLKVKRGKINNKTAVDVETELLSVGDIGNTMFPFHDVSTVYFPILYISNRQSECIYIYLYTKKKIKSVVQNADRAAFRRFRNKVWPKLRRFKKIHEVKVKRRYIWKVLGFLPT